MSEHVVEGLGEDLHNDVVDWDVNELHKESNEPHDSKSDCSCHGNALELCGKSGQLVATVYTQASPTHCKNVAAQIFFQQ